MVLFQLPFRKSFTAIESPTTQQMKAVPTSISEIIHSLRIFEVVFMVAVPTSISEIIHSIKSIRDNDCKLFQLPFRKSFTATTLRTSIDTAAVPTSISEIIHSKNHYLTFSMHAVPTSISEIIHSLDELSAGRTGCSNFHFGNHSQLLTACGK